MNDNPDYVYLKSLPDVPSEVEVALREAWGSAELKAALKGYNGGNVDVGQLHMGVVRVGDVQAITVGMGLEDDARLGPRHRTTYENFGIQRDREPASDLSEAEKEAMNLHPEAPFCVVGVVETADGTPRLIGMQRFQHEGEDVVMVSA